MRGAIPPLPQYAFMAWCLVKHRDNFTLPLPSCHWSRFHLYPNSLTIVWTSEVGAPSVTLCCLEILCCNRFSNDVQLLLRYCFRVPTLPEGEWMRFLCQISPFWLKSVRTRAVRPSPSTQPHVQVHQEKRAIVKTLIIKSNTVFTKL
jgi:hypothetical protein